MAKKSKTCKRRRVRKNKDGSFNKEDLKHNQKCSEKLAPWMKDVLNEKNKTEYDKYLAELIKINVINPKRKRQRTKRKK
jgi:hypothetical protein